MNKKEFNALKKVPDEISGEVFGVVVDATPVGSGEKRKLSVDIAVSPGEGQDWYKMTASVPVTGSLKWILTEFCTACEAGPEEIAACTTGSEIIEKLKTHIKLDIVHNGIYTNVRKYKALKQTPKSEADWGAVMANISGRLQKPKVQEEQPEAIPEATPEVKPAQVTTPAAVQETTLQPQAIDLSWVTTENLVTELARRGLHVSTDAPAKPAPAAPAAPATTEEAPEDPEDDVALDDLLGLPDADTKTSIDDLLGLPGDNPETKPEQKTEDPKKPWPKFEDPEDAENFSAMVEAVGYDAALELQAELDGKTTASEEDDEDEAGAW